MKKIIVLLIVLFCIVDYKCQNNNSVVFSIDLSDPSASKDLIQNTQNRNRLVAKNREIISFRLMNPNPFKYKYKLQKNFINFFAPDRPSVKKDEGTNSPASTAVPDKPTEEKKAIKTIDLLKSTIFSIPVKTPQVRYKKEEIERVNNEINSLNTQLKKDTSSTSVNKRIDSISSKTFSEGEKKKIQKQLNEIRLNLSISNSKKYTYTDHDVNDSVQAVEVVQKALYKLKSKTSTIERELKNYIREISAKETFNTKEYTEKIDAIQYDYEKHLRYLSNLENEAEPFNNDEHKETIKSIKDSNTSIGDQLDKLCDLNFENFLLPIDTNGENIDAVEVVLDRYTNEQSPKHIDSNKYTIWIQGGLKLDISAGIFITSLVDNEYYTEKKDDTPNLYSIYKKDKGNFDFGFGSMINLTYRSGNWANPTFGVGAIFTAQQKFQIISGLGLVMGRKERLILHGGISMGQVQGALGRFKDDGTEIYNLGDNPVVPMENKFRFGYFFGFTYNITGFKINNKP